MSVKQVIVTTSVTACLLIGGLTAFAQTPAKTTPPPPLPNAQPSQSTFIPRLELHRCPVNAVMPVSPSAVRIAIWSLKLPNEQQTKAYAIVTASDKKVNDLTSQSKTRNDMLDALKAVPFDRSKVELAAAATMKQEQAVVNERIEMWTSLMQMLTPDQQKRFWDRINGQVNNMRRIQPPPAPGTQGTPVPPVASTTK